MQKKQTTNVNKQLFTNIYLQLSYEIIHNDRSIIPVPDLKYRIQITFVFC